MIFCKRTHKVIRSIFTDIAANFVNKMLPVRNGGSYPFYYLITQRTVSSGILRAGRSVDREVAAEYNLIIRAGNDYCGVNKTDIDGT